MSPVPPRTLQPHDRSATQTLGLRFQNSRATSVVRFSLLSALLVSSLRGSGPTYSDVSALTERRNISALVRAASANRPMRVSGDYTRTGRGEVWAKTEHEADLECDESTLQNFLLALRGATHDFLLKLEATTQGAEDRLAIEKTRGFTWEYRWSGNLGFLHVRYYPLTRGRGRLHILCYEHLKALRENKL